MNSPVMVINLFYFWLARTATRKTSNDKKKNYDVSYSLWSIKRIIFYIRFPYWFYYFYNTIQRKIGNFSDFSKKYYKHSIYIIYIYYKENLFHFVRISRYWDTSSQLFNEQTGNCPSVCPYAISGPHSRAYSGQRFTSINASKLG